VETQDYADLDVRTEGRNMDGNDSASVSEM